MSRTEAPNRERSGTATAISKGMVRRAVPSDKSLASHFRSTKPKTRSRREPSGRQDTGGAACDKVSGRTRKPRAIYKNLDRPLRNTDLAENAEANALALCFEECASVFFSQTESAAPMSCNDGDDYLRLSSFEDVLQEWFAERGWEDDEWRHLSPQTPNSPCEVTLASELHVELPYSLCPPCPDFEVVSAPAIDRDATATLSTPTLSPDRKQTSKARLSKNRVRACSLARRRNLRFPVDPHDVSWLLCRETLF